MVPDDFELKIDFKYQKFIRQNYSEDFYNIQKELKHIGILLDT